MSAHPIALDSIALESAQTAMQDFALLDSQEMGVASVPPAGRTMVPIFALSARIITLWLVRLAKPVIRLVPLALEPLPLIVLRALPISFTTRRPNPALQIAPQDSSWRTECAPAARNPAKNAVAQGQANVPNAQSGRSTIMASVALPV